MASVNVNKSTKALKYRHMFFLIKKTTKSSFLCQTFSLYTFRKKLHCRYLTGSLIHFQAVLTSRQRETCKFIKKETVEKLFSCEFCKMFIKTFFIEHLRAIEFEFRKKTILRSAHQFRNFRNVTLLISENDSLRK